MTDETTPDAVEMLHEWAAIADSESIGRLEMVRVALLAERARHAEEVERLRRERGKARTAAAHHFGRICQLSEEVANRVAEMRAWGESKLTGAQHQIDALQSANSDIREQLAEARRERDDLKRHYEEALECEAESFREQLRPLERRLRDLAQRLRDVVSGPNDGPLNAEDYAERVIDELTEALRERDEARACIPSRCPITGREHFADIEHPDLGMVPTYGGPYDSYTIPERDDEGRLYRERYDHDRGGWTEGTEDIGLMVVEDEAYESALCDLDEARRERDDLRYRFESWKEACLAWQEWAQKLTGVEAESAAHRDQIRAELAEARRERDGVRGRLDELGILFQEWQRACLDWQKWAREHLGDERADSPRVRRARGRLRV